MSACHAEDRGFESRLVRHDGPIAQMVEQWTENPRVAGSIPAWATINARKRILRSPFF